MNISDPEAIFQGQGKEILLDILSTHPFLPELDKLISTLIVKSEDGLCPNVKVSGSDVTLTIQSTSVFDDRFLYILYHEFGHVTDRFNPEFKYSEKVRGALTDLKDSNFMELWNLHIDARLNKHGLFRLVCIGTPSVRVNGKRRLIKCSLGSKLNDHVEYLTKRGFRDARKVVRQVWKMQKGFISFPEFILLIEQQMN